MSKGVIWDTNGQDFRVYSSEAYFFTVSLLQKQTSFSLEITETETSSFSSDLLNNKQSSDSEETDSNAEEEEVDEKSNEDDGTKVLVYGTTSSFNRLYDAILFG